MSEDRRKILEMVKQGKISVAEAEELLDASQAAPETQPVKAKPKYLRIVVREGEQEGGKNEVVDIRVPFQLVRSGIKLGAFIPQDAREKMSGALREKGMDIDLANLDPKAVEELIDGLADLSINVGDNADTVRIFCE